MLSNHNSLHVCVLCYKICYSGGLSNLLYYVALPDSLLLESKLQGEPREVLVRVYGQTHGEGAIEALITESVIFTLLSERGLGPKLHGIFPGGRIEQYMDARPLLTKELAQENLSIRIAQKMASIHSMEVRISLRFVGLLYYWVFVVLLEVIHFIFFSIIFFLLFY